MASRAAAEAAENLYRAHRQIAPEEDAAADENPDDGIAELRERIEAVRRQLLSERTEA